MRLLLIIFIASCSADSAPLDDIQDGQGFQQPLDLSAFGECAPATFVKLGSGCVAEWTCGEAGLLSLSCEPGDGGALTCACAANQSANLINGEPADCADEASVLGFVRDHCGWGWL